MDIFARFSVLGTRYSVLDSVYRILDAGQIMEDLIPMSLLEGGAVIGNAGCWSNHGRFEPDVISGGNRFNRGYWMFDVGVYIIFNDPLFIQ